MIKEVFAPERLPGVLQFKLADHILKTVILQDGSLRCTIPVPDLAGLAAKINHHTLAVGCIHDIK